MDNNKNSNIHKSVSSLSDVIEAWLMDPLNFNINNEILALEKGNSKIFGKSQTIVKTENEVNLLVEFLKEILKLLEEKHYLFIDKILSGTLFLFLRIKSVEIFQLIQKNALAPLKTLFLNYINNLIPQEFNQNDNDLMILKIFAFYSDQDAIDFILKSLIKKYKPYSEMWDIIFAVLAQEEYKAKYIIESIKPEQLAGLSLLCFLDLSNHAILRFKLQNHPFNSDPGIIILRELLSEENKFPISYARSASMSLPFLKNPDSLELIKLTESHSDSEVQLNGIWAAIHLGKAEKIPLLKKFAADLRFSRKAVNFLKRLNLKDHIPKVVNEPDFKVQVQLCEWLARPNEFGRYPDHLKIIDDRILNWPPTSDRRNLYLIQYEYNNYNTETNSIQTSIGVGMVGSITFSFINEINPETMTPLEIYAIHCNWELHEEDYMNIEKGLSHLKQYNKMLFR